MRCISPMSVPRPNGSGKTDRIVVPCGKCLPCLSNKRAQWSFRLVQELKKSYSAHFVTLTYDENHLPYGENDPSLSKAEIQSFIKRLRYYVTQYEKVSQNGQKGPQIKYFIVGEYGGITNRPHYHCIIFNLPIIDAENILVKAWSVDGVPLGFVHVGSVTPRSISYTAKYCINEIANYGSKENVFSLISKGIGSNYVERMSHYHNSNNIFYGVADHGKKVSLPRYYRDKIFTKLKTEVNKKKYQKISDDQLNEKEKEFLKRGENLFEHDLQSKEQTNERIKSRLKTNQKL